MSGKNIQIDGQTRTGCNTGQVTVGTSVVTASASTAKLKFGVKVFADADNTNPLWVGFRSNLSAGTGDTSGVKLSPGSSEFFPAETEADVTLISDAAAQSATYISI